MVLVTGVSYGEKSPEAKSVCVGALNKFTFGSDL